MLWFILLGFAGWPVAAFIRSRISCGQPTLIALRAAAFALLATLLVGIPLVDSWLIRREINPAETGTTVIFALVVVWGCIPYTAISIWLIRRLFFPHAENTPNT